jgi:hypothetical protein
VIERRNAFIVRSNEILLQCKIDYYSSKIADIGNDHKKLFKLTNSLLGNNNEVVLPSHQSEFELSNRLDVGTTDVDSDILIIVVIVVTTLSKQVFNNVVGIGPSS